MQQEETKQGSEENNFQSFIKEYGFPLALTVGISTYCFLYPNSMAKTWKCIKKIPIPVTVFTALTGGYVIGNVIDNNRKIKLLTQRQEKFEEKIERQSHSFEKHVDDVKAVFPRIGKQLTSMQLDLETLAALQAYVTQNLQKNIECQQEHINNINTLLPMVGNRLFTMQLGIATCITMQTCAKYEHDSLRVALIGNFMELKHKFNEFQETQRGLVELNSIYDGLRARFNYENDNPLLLEDAKNDPAG